MPTIRIDSFAGIMPRVHPTLLPDGCAVKAHNCRLQSGKLSPLRQPAKVVSVIRMENGLERIADAKSIYLWNGVGKSEFLAWPGIVTVARGNIADDDLRRIFVTGDTGIGGDGKNLPCVYIMSPDGKSFIRHPITKEKLPAPVVTRANDQVLDEANLRYTFFFQSWVDEYGYESGLSQHSDNSTAENTDGDLLYNDGDEVTVAEIIAPEGAVARRIYKVVTGATTESVQFVAEQPVAGDGFSALTFRVKDEDAGEVVPMFQSPPDDFALMTYVANGFYVGISRSRKRTLMFSETNMPTSFPDAYMMDVQDDIVCIAVAGNTVYALTEGFPCAYSGTSPDAISETPIKIPQSCVSSRSACVMESAVFYASHDGIVMLSPSLGDTAQVITEKHFSKREWMALNPASCVMGVYDGAIHAWFTPEGAAPQGYVIDLREGAAAITTHDEVAKAVHYDPLDDTLYYVRSS